MQIPYRFLRRTGIIIFLIVGTWFALSALHKFLDPNVDGVIDRKADAEWIATSKWWLDRQACRWIGLCGLAHFHSDPAKSWKHRQYAREQELLMNGEKGHPGGFSWEDMASNGKKMRPDDWQADSRVLKEVPQFVLDHAPIVHLYSDEQFWPSNIAEHLENMYPYVNHTSLRYNSSKPSVDNLHELNEGRWAEELFLQSKDDVEDRPDWLGSAYNKPIPYDDDDDEEDESAEPTVNIKLSEIPLSEEEIKEWSDPYALPEKIISAPFTPDSLRTQKSAFKRSRGNPRNKKRSPVLAKPGGYSPAPAYLVIVDKGHGVIDAFWFYFYSYNLGTTVLGIRFGNHIGDWEHSLMRFHNGVPKAVFFSAHAGGLAYSYDAVEKGKGKGREGRPIIYSAKGSHAMYATPGTHPYILPFGILADVADKGPLWDPALNYVAYHFNTTITHGADAYNHFLPDLSNPTPAEMEDTIQPALNNPNAAMGWWWYSGHWGDNLYTLGDWRQWRFVGQYHYVNGPYGPRWKNLGRSKVCQSHGTCTILKSLVGDSKRTWLGTRAIDTFSAEVIR